MNKKNKTKRINLSEYNWPEVAEVDEAFPTFVAPDDLLEEATQRGHLHNENKEGNIMFSQIFFNKGKIIFKKNLTEGQKKAWLWCTVFIGSYDPKHEHKEAIAGMIMEEVVEKIK